VKENHLKEIPKGEEKEEGGAQGKKNIKTSMVEEGERS